MNEREIAKFSPATPSVPEVRGDARAGRRLLEPTLTRRRPNLCGPASAICWQLGQLGWSFRKLGDGRGEAVEILTGAARPILDRWFESEQLKVTLATDAIIGAIAAPSMPGTAYVLFHHVMGECNGVRGVWGYVRGGMGGITQALRAPRATGVEIRYESRGRRASSSRTAGPRRRSRGRQRVLARRRHQRGRQRDVPQAPRPEGAAAPILAAVKPSTTERVAEDQRGARASCRLHGPARAPARPAAPRHDPHLSRPWTTSSTPTTTPSTAGRRNSDPRMHDPLGAGRTLAPPGKAPDLHVRAVRARTNCRGTWDDKPTSSPTAASRCWTAWSGSVAEMRPCGELGQSVKSLRTCRPPGAWPGSPRSSRRTRGCFRRASSTVC